MSCGSAAQTQTLDEGAVTLDVDRFEVAQHALAATDQEQQATAAVVVVRGVANPMMLAMCEHAAHFAQIAVDRANLPREEADAVLGAFRRFTTSVGSVITYGYDQAVADALYNIAGMRPGLLERLRDQEVNEALGHARGVLAR